MRITKREAVAYTVATIIIGISWWYCYLTITDKIQPVLSTWLLAFVAATLGLSTYLGTGKTLKHLFTNVLNATDIVSVTTITVCVLFFSGELTLGFNAFDLWCFAGAGGILLYYACFRNAKVANIAVNALLVVAYFPLIRRLLTSDHNTESFLVWSVWQGVALLSLYNPIKERDALVILYAARAAVSIFIVLLLMLRLEFVS